MKHITGALLFFIFSVGVLSAGPIRDEYFKTKDDIDKSKDTPEMRKQFLEMNIQRSLRRLLVRYYGYQKPDNIKISNSNYEKSEKDPLTILNLKITSDFSRSQIIPNIITLFQAKRKYSKNQQQHKNNKMAGC